MTDENPMATVLSIDGVGAYDHVCRSAMMKKLYSFPSLRSCFRSFAQRMRTPRNMCGKMRQECSTESFKWKVANTRTL